MPDRPGAKGLDPFSSTAAAANNEYEAQIHKARASCSAAQVSLRNRVAARVSVHPAVHGSHVQGGALLWYRRVWSLSEAAVQAFTVQPCKTVPTGGALRGRMYS